MNKYKRKRAYCCRLWKRTRCLQYTATTRSVPSWFSRPVCQVMIMNCEFHVPVCDFLQQLSRDVCFSHPKGLKWASYGDFLHVLTVPLCFSSTQRYLSNRK